RADADSGAVFEPQDRDDFGAIDRAEDLVHFEVGIDHRAGARVENLVFEEGVADALYHAAADLALRGQPVDRLAAVLQRDNAQHADDAGAGVDFDFGELHGFAAALAPVLVVEVAQDGELLACDLFARGDPCGGVRNLVLDSRGLLQLRAGLLGGIAN